MVNLSGFRDVSFHDLGITGLRKDGSLYIGNIALPIQVNAGFLFYVPLQNLRHLDATYAADNQ